MTRSLSIDNFRHLIELRARLIRCLQVFALIFAVCFWFSDTLYATLAELLLKQLPAGASLIATQVTATFMVPMQLAVNLALILSMPVCLIQLWNFIAPGLYKREAQSLWPVLLASLSLFYSGLLFAFFVLCPMALGFFARAAPRGVQVMTDMSHYLQFVTRMLLASGLAFQVPIVTFLALKWGWVSSSQLRAQRPYVIVGAFTLGMVLTPPDVVSQILLSVPMWGMFELALLLAARSHPAPALESSRSA